MGLGDFLFGSQDTSMETGPWSRMGDQIKDEWKGLKQLQRSGDWENALRYGPFSVVPGMNRDFRQGFGQIRDTAGQNLGLRNSLNAAKDTAQGQYLYGNPGFDAAVQASLDTTTPMINAGFGGAGRTGSAYHAKTLGDAASRAFAGQYGQERGRQMQAAGMIPGIAQAQFMPGQMLSDIGMQRFNLFQSPRARENVMRWQQNAGAPLGAQQGLFNAATQAGGMGSSGGQTGGSMGAIPFALGTALTAGGLGAFGGGGRPGWFGMGGGIGGMGGGRMF